MLVSEVPHILLPPTFRVPDSLHEQSNCAACDVAPAWELGCVIFIDWPRYFS